MERKIVKNIAKILLGVLVIFIISKFVRGEIEHIKEFSPEYVKNWIATFGNKAPIVYVFAYALNTILPFPPLAILSLTAGLAFGKLSGAVYLLLGHLIGGTMAFFIARGIAKNALEKMLKGKIKEFDDAMETKGFLTVLFLRLVPIIPHEIFNYAAGVTKIRYRDYIFATFLGIIPYISATAYFGSELGKASSIRDLISFKFVLTAAAVIAIISLPVIYKILNKRNQKIIEDKK